MLTRNTRRRIPRNRRLWNFSPLEMWKVSNNQANSIVLSWCFFKKLFPSGGTRFSTSQHFLRWHRARSSLQFSTVTGLLFLVLMAAAEQLLVVSMSYAEI